MKKNLLRQRKTGGNSRTTTVENKQNLIQYQSQRVRRSNRIRESNNHTTRKIYNLDKDQEL